MAQVEMREGERFYCTSTRHGSERIRGSLGLSQLETGIPNGPVVVLSGFKVGQFYTPKNTLKHLCRTRPKWIGHELGKCKQLVTKLCGCGILVIPSWRALWHRLLSFEEDQLPLLLKKPSRRILGGEK
jgi:hypothetical protein